MARIRTIKPEFPQSESMGNVSREARLLFPLLWTIADDHGKCRGTSRMLASLLFPYDQDAPALIDDWLSELEGQGCIQRYRVDGASYIKVTNWLKHQRIDKPSKSKFPDPQDTREPSANTREPSRQPREHSSEDQGSEDQGSKDRGRVSEDSETTDHLAIPEFLRRGSTKLASAIAPDWLPSQSAQDQLAKSRPDLTSEIVQRRMVEFRNWCAEKGTQTHNADATWFNFMVKTHGQRPASAGHGSDSGSAAARGIDEA